LLIYKTSVIYIATQKYLAYLKAIFRFRNYFIKSPLIVDFKFVNEEITN